MHFQALSFGPTSAAIIAQHLLDWENLADNLNAQQAPTEQVDDVNAQIALLANQSASLEQYGRLTINFPPAASALELVQRQITDWQSLHDQLTESGADPEKIEYCEEKIAALQNEEFDLINGK